MSHDQHSQAHETNRSASAPSAPFPDLQIVSQRPGDAGIEEQLRDMMSNAPYLGAALAVHALILLVFLNMSIDPPDVTTELVINGSQPDVSEPLPPVEPPEPPDFEPPEPVETPDPVVTEMPATADNTPDADLPPLTGDPSDTTSAAVIGVGKTGSPVGAGGPHKIPGHGGDPPTMSPNDPVRLGLEWLAHHQSDDGHWSCAGFSDECGKQGQDTVCDGSGNPAHDVGVTALSLLAFMGAGHTDKEGEHKQVVRAGLQYLRAVQALDGNFGLAQQGSHSYDHILATLAFVEAYARTGGRHLKEPAERGLAYMETLRNPGGAWRYAPEHPEMMDPARQNDTSVTGWAILALTTAKEAGLDYDADALLDAMDFLDEVTDPLTGRSGYTRMGEPSAREAGRQDLWPSSLSESLTAVALLSRIFADPEMQRPGHLDLVRLGIQRLVDLPPLWSADQPGRVDFYSWYYGANALYQFQEVDLAPWRTWEAPLRKALRAHQHVEGEQRGSWDPQADPWGHLGGRVYATAMLTLTLEISYRYGTVLSPR